MALLTPLNVVEDDTLATTSIRCGALFGATPTLGRMYRKECAALVSSSSWTCWSVSAVHDRTPFSSVQPVSA